MLRCPYALCILMLLAASLRAQSGGQDDTSDPAPASSERIQGLIMQLDHKQYKKRMNATARLIDIGAPAISPLTLAMQEGASLEMQTRGVMILKELALSEQVTTQDLAADALQRIAADGTGMVARRSAEVLDQLTRIRAARARKQFLALGGSIGAIDNMTQELGMIVDTTAWRGTKEDLALLRWDTQLRAVALMGPIVNDEWLVELAKLQNMQYVSVKRAKITNEGLKHLQTMQRLTKLDLFYCPIRDDGLKNLLPQATKMARLRLYGTDVTELGAATFGEQVNNVTVDYKRGAFLGVECPSTFPVCRISSVSPGQAADRAGVKPDDILIRFGTAPIGEFEDLRKAIANNLPGESVNIEVLRGYELAYYEFGFSQADDKLGLEAEQVPIGLRVTKVVEGGLAHRADVQVGDIVGNPGPVRFKSVAELEQFLRDRVESAREKGQKPLPQNFEGYRHAKSVKTKVVFGEWD